MLLFLLAFYIIRYYFLYIFNITSLNIIWKKKFCHRFYFFNGFTSLNSQWSKIQLATSAFISCFISFVSADNHFLQLSRTSFNIHNKPLSLCIDSSKQIKWTIDDCYCTISCSALCHVLQLFLWKLFYVILLERWNL